MSEAGEFFKTTERRGDKGGNVGGTARQLSVWSEVSLPVLEAEDRLDKETAAALWNKVYALYGATGEEMRKEVRLAVFSYFALNGSSRYGTYERSIRIGSGVAVVAKDVVQVIGHTRLRQFLRADTREVYNALKGSKVLEHDEVAAARAAEMGLPADQPYLMADFLRGCPVFSSTERDTYARVFESNIARAGVNRGGKSVEQAARDSDARAVEAQRVAVAQQHVGDVF